MILLKMPIHTLVVSSINQMSASTFMLLFPGIKTEMDNKGSDNGQVKHLKTQGQINRKKTYNNVETTKQD